MLASSRKILLLLTLIGVSLPASSIAQEKTFATPNEAVQALIQAVQGPETDKSLAGLFGDGAKDLWNSGDPVEDRQVKQNFLKRASEKNEVVSMDATHSILYLGADRWSFPIPLTKGEKGWYFDTAIGKQEILNRRIGANELAAIASARDFVKSEQEYASKNTAGDKSYAQKILSDPGKNNGLLNATSPLVVQAKAEGYTAGMESKGDLLYHGYYFRVLTEQGKDATGGAKNYVVDGKMTQGFALLAYPAKWNDSGVMTFLVNQEGKVLQKNLGEKTQEIAPKMLFYNPDGSWQASSPQ